MTRRRSGLYLAGALLCLQLPAGAALAQTVPGAESLARLIRLLDGSLYHGELVEQVPNDHITLKLATGEVRRFQWGEIAAVTTPAPASAPSPPGAPLGPPVPPSAMPALAPANQGPLVRLNADDQEAMLYQQTGTSMVVASTYRGTFAGQMEFWNPVCRVPCEQPVSPNVLYSIRGRNIVPSPTFSLPGSGGVNVDVKAGHLLARSGGWVLTGLGVGAVVSGIALVAMGNRSSNVPSDPFFAQQRSDEEARLSTYRTAGGVVLGVGIPALVGGIVILSQARTKVLINNQPVALLRLPRPGPLYVSARGLMF